MNTEKKNNKFFLNLENRAASKTCIRKVFNKEEKMIVEPNAVSTNAVSSAVLYNFYADLYENKDSEHYLVIGEEFLDRCMNLPKHSDEKKLVCEGPLTYTECFKALGEFQNGKSPGNDGLSAEFYKAFWRVVGHLMVDSLNCAFEHGELSTSQKQGIIKLIDKKNKDKRYIANWRPVSLLNVDTKIASKVITTRLQKILPELISEEQCASVKG